MKKEIVMKRIIAAFALFTVATIGMVTRVSAQEQTFQVTVPFAFTVGNRQLPLGNYRIETFGTTQVRINNMEQSVFASTLGNPGYRSEDEHKKLVFNKVGGQYFLKEIVSASTAVEFPKSESEKRAETVLQQSPDSYAKTVTP
jgi:hypothetical protein